jgi:prepilin-type N-terminal cleavage/methylation domain-containing protein
MIRNRGFSLLEMMIVVSLVSVALIPLFKWQTFVLSCLKTQDDTTCLLTDMRRAQRYIDRDVTTALSVVSSPPGSPDNPLKVTTDSSSLVLHQQDPDQTGFYVVYRAATSQKKMTLTRGLYDLKGKLLGQEKTVVNFLKTIQFTRTSDKTIQTTLEVEIGSENSRQFQTLNLLSILQLGESGTP